MKKYLSLLSAVTLTASFVVATTTAASASVENTCQLLAWTPGHSFSTHNVWGQGGRSGCINSAIITVDVMKDVSFGFDKSYATGTQTGKDLKFTVYGKISDDDYGEVFYTLTTSSTGNSRESARITFK